MSLFKYILLLMIVIMCVAFALLNSTVVTIHYLIAKIDMTLSMALLMVFAVGLVLGLLLNAGMVIKLKKQLRKEQPHD